MTEMIAFHGALTTVNYVDHLRRRFETTQQSFADDDQCTDNEVAVASTVDARRWTSRARSLPPDCSETTTCRRLVTRGTQTSILAGYVNAAVDSGSDDKAWLRRIDAMDLSFPVSHQSELRGFLADILSLAEHRGDVDGKQAATSTPRTPQMKRRRWAACDLCLDDGPTTTGDGDDLRSTALDDDPDEWTDDDEEEEILSSMSVYGRSDVVMRPTITLRTPRCSAAETRSYFRSGCRTVSRLPAPNMPMIREDEQASSADDEDPAAGDIPTSNGRSPPSAEPPPSPGLPQPSSTGSQRTLCGRATVASPIDELASCCRGPVETPTNDDPQPVPPTSSSPSLLDTMHKIYCASQYARRQTPSIPGCNDNTHLLGVVTRTSPTPQNDARPSADCDCDAVNDFITDTAQPVTGNHVTSSTRRRVCDATSGAEVDSYEANDASARPSTTSSTDVMSSTLSTTGFDDDEDDEVDDDEENGELKDDEQRNKTGTIYDDQPWKQRFCDYCHGELQVIRCLKQASQWHDKRFTPWHAV